MTKKIPWEFLVKILVKIFAGMGYCVRRILSV